MRYFIRFTETAKSDVRRGTSIDVFSDEEVEGIYAFNFCDHPEMYDYGHSDLETEAMEKAQNLARWNGAGYAEESNGRFAVIEGEYIESANDGVLIEPNRVIFEANIDI